ncbi:unnamed protein product [Rhodiola kirilowii]
MEVVQKEIQKLLDADRDLSDLGQSMGKPSSRGAEEDWDNGPRKMPRGNWLRLE